MKSTPFLSLLTQNIPFNSKKEMFQSSTSENKLSFSKELLNKDLLFTPHLKKKFRKYICL